MRIASVRGAFISTVGDPLFDGFIAFVLSGALLYCLAATEATANELPQPDHVVVVVFENRSFDQIVDSDQAPFINRIAKSGALLSTRLQSRTQANRTTLRYLADPRRALATMKIIRSMRQILLARSLRQAKTLSAISSPVPRANTILGSRS